MASEATPWSESGYPCRLTEGRAWLRGAGDTEQCHGKRKPLSRK